MPSHLLDPRRKRLGLMKREDVPAGGLRIERVRKPRLGAGRLVNERQSTFERSWDVVWDAVDVFRCLPSDTSESFALFLRFERTDGIAVHKEQIVSPAVSRCEHELPHGHSARR